MKKALSVFLSLLMVITTISVVFTLPASAATTVLYSENFDSLPEGEITTNTEVPSGNGWIKLMPNLSSNTSSYKGTVLNPQTYADIDYATGGFTAVSPNNVIRFGNWQAYGYVFDVEPNTKYTVNAKTLAFENTNKKQYGKSQDHNTRITAVDITGATGKLVKTSSGNGTAVKDATTQFSNKMSGSNTANTTDNNVVNQWVDRTLTFTTTAQTTKMILLFTIEHNNFTANVDDGNGGTVSKTISYAGVDNGYLMDDLVITYDAKPTVKAVTYGADTKNGGVAWVETDISGSVDEGANVTYKARPYDSALFDGFYSVVGTTETKITDGVTNNGDGSYTLTNRPWNLSENIIAKFRALSENLFPDVENRTTYNTNGAKFTGDAKYTHVSGRTVTHTLVDSKLLTAGSCYGYSGTLTNARAYSGKLSFTPPSLAGHRSYQIVKVKPNTDYTLSFWYYQDTTVLFSGTNSNAMIGSINLDLATNPYTAETNEPEGSKIIRVTSGGNNIFTDFTNTDGVEVQKRDIGAVWSNTAVTGRWAKATATFTSDEKGWVVIPFGGGNAVYIDHITLYEEPEIITPKVNSVSNFGSNDGIVYNVTNVYTEGETFTATAMPYDNAKFVGFYVGDVKLTEGVTENANGSYTATFTYNENATYTARFEAIKPNLWPDASMEATPAISAGTGIDSTTALYYRAGSIISPQEIPANGWSGFSWGTYVNADASYINGLKSGLKAYSGNNALCFQTNNSHAAIKVIRDLKTNAKYKLVYYAYNSNVKADGTEHTGYSTDSDDDVVNNENWGITAIPTGATSFYRNDRGVKIGSNGQSMPVQTVTTTPVKNEWYLVERTFETGSNTDFLIQLNNTDCTIVMYDHFALYEVPVNVTPNITIEDNGMNAGVVYNVSSVMCEDSGNAVVGNDEFTATTKPYENGAFVGFFKDGVKLADDKVVANADGSYTATFNYTPGSLYTVKYNAEVPNLFEEGSFEGYIGASNKMPGLSSDENFPSMILWSTWNTQSVSPNEDGWVGSNYGRAYVATYGALNELFNGATPYTGNNVLVVHTGSHTAGKIIDVEPNTRYKLVYYTYSFAKNALTTDKRNPIGIDMTNNSVYLGSSTSGKNGSFATDGTNGQTALSTTWKNYDRETVGEWVRQEAVFETGDSTSAIIQFGSTTSQGYAIDHVTVYKLPNPATVAKGNEGGYVKVNGNFISVTSVDAGETVTIKAEPFAGNKFLGWYADASLTGKAIYEDAEITITAESDAKYYAKFQNANVLEDYSFENMPLGSIESLYETYGWYTGTASGYKVLDDKSEWFDISVVSGTERDVTPYSGNKMIKVGHHSNGGWFKNIAVKNNTTYTLSFKYAFNHTINKDGTHNTTKFQGITVATRDYLAYGLPGNGHYILDTSVGNNAYETIPTEDGVWYDYEFTFNSGNRNSINVMAQFATAILYIDDMTLVEHPAPTVTVATIGAFGKATTAVGGRAYAIVNSDKLNEVSYHAYANEGNQFLGWYEGDTFVSNEADVYYSGACPNLTAKFMDMGYDSALAEFGNLYSNATNGFDGSFESLNHGWLVGGDDDYKPTINTIAVEDKNYYTFNFDGGSLQNPGFGSIWTYSSRNNYGGIKVVDDIAHTGKQSLLIREGVKGAAVQNKLTDLNTNTDYVVSFYYYIPNSVGDNFMDEVAVLGADYLSSDTIGNISTASNQLLNKVEFGASNTTYGMWQKVSISFNTGDLTEVILHILYSGGVYDNSVLTGTNCYLDTFALNLKADYESAASAAFSNSLESKGVAIRAAGTDKNGNEVKQALRFKTRIAKNYIEEMVLGADYTVIEYGSIAMRADAIDGKANFTMDYKDANGKSPVRGVTYRAETGTNRIFQYKPNERDLVFTAALTGITEANYKTDYSVRTYAIVELADGSKVTIYDTNVYTTNVYYIAKLAYADVSVENPELSEEEQVERKALADYLYNNIISVVEASQKEASSALKSFPTKQTLS